jgi:hypothetical protein
VVGDGKLLVDFLIVDGKPLTCRPFSGRSTVGNQPSAISNEHSYRAAGGKA